MRRVLIALVFAGFLCGSTVTYADSAPFGVASAFNLVALGTVNSSGQTVIAGNIGTQADVEGRMAAANQITQATTIGSTLRSDPYGSLAGGYALVAGGGVTAGNYFNINGGGNVYASTNSAGYNWNENPRGSLVKSGPSPINFSSLRSTLDAETLQLASLTANGVVGAPTPHGGNPSWLVLSGSSATLNVFTVTAAQFADANHPLDIVVPAGSTVIINVQGTNVTLGTGIYFNGTQESDSNDDSNDILFNFAGASTVAIDGQLNGAVLAPFALLTGSSQMGGNFIAAQIGQTGEIHNDEFSGTLPNFSPENSFPTEAPEPGTLVLMGGGILFLASLLGIRRQNYRRTRP
jgi:choice-of-anchor A domain-containing protein